MISKIEIIAKIKTLEPLKLLMYLWILLLPWDLYNGFMGTSVTVMTLLWLLIGKQKGYFCKLKEIFANKPLVLFISFILYAYLSLLWSNNLERGLVELKYYKYYWVLIPLIYTVFSKDDLKIAFSVLLFSFGFYAVFSLLIFFELIKIEGANRLDPRGVLAYANVTLYMAISTLYSFYFFLLEKSNKIKHVFLFVSFISLCALFVNNGRSAQIAFLGTILIVFLFYFKHMLKFKYIALFSVCLIFLAAVFYYNPNRLDRFKIGYNELVNVFEKNEFKGSWGVRAYMWFAAADSISRHPFFGAGTGDTIDELIEFGKKNPSPATHLRTYHNQHLDYLTKYGIVGYILFLSGIASLLIQLYKNKSCFFPLGLIFFSMILIDSMGSTVLGMKPFHNIYVLVFVILTIASEKQLKCEERDLNPHGFIH